MLEKLHPENILTNQFDLSIIFFLRKGRKKQPCSEDHLRSSSDKLLHIDFGG